MFFLNTEAPRWVLSGCFLASYHRHHHNLYHHLYHQIAAEPYVHQEIAAEPYQHVEIAAEPYLHIEPNDAYVAGPIWSGLCVNNLGQSVACRQN